MPSQHKLIAFALYPGVTPLDLVGPLTVLRNLTIRSPYRTVVVGERIEPMDTDTSVRIVPAKAFADVPDPFALIVPGGGTATIAAMRDDSLLAYVRSAARTAEIVGSTGNGALVLAAAGLLQGRRVATHWAYADLLEKLGACYAPEPWIDDGAFLTAGGGSAGIDLMLHLLARLKDRSSATLAQLFIEYDPEPPFGRIARDDPDSGVAEILRVPSAHGYTQGSGEGGSHVGR
jgi:transcriptional regulator GlxA family with amidase domain